MTEGRRSTETRAGVATAAAASCEDGERGNDNSRHSNDRLYKVSMQKCNVMLLYIDECLVEENRKEKGNRYDEGGR